MILPKSLGEPMHLIRSMGEDYLQKHGHFTSNRAAAPSKAVFLPATSTAFIPSERVGLSSFRNLCLPVYPEDGTEPVVSSAEHGHREIQESQHFHTHLEHVPSKGQFLHSQGQEHAQSSGWKVPP